MWEAVPVGGREEAQRAPGCSGAGGGGGGRRGA